MFQSVKDSGSDSCEKSRTRAGSIVVKTPVESSLPNTFQDRNAIAFNLVPTALTEVFGRRGEGWHSYMCRRRCIIEPG
jgi:hypothetical protein